MPRLKPRKRKVSYAICGIFYPEEIYSYCEMQIKQLMEILPGDRMLLVGDSLSTDILGGMNYNIDTCFYNPNNIIVPDKYNPTICVNKLLELKKKL